MFTFVLLGREADNYDYVYKQESVNFEEIVFVEHPKKTFRGIKSFLYRLHNSERINRILPLPFRTVWGRFVLNKEVKRGLKEKKELCFIVSGEGYSLKRIGLFNYIRNAFPGAKLVYSFTDKVELYKREYGGFIVDDIIKEFDFVYTYNNLDALQYDIALRPPKIIDYSAVPDALGLPETDVFFVGLEKGRLDQILQIYEKCREKGFICDFHIVGVEEEKQRYKDDIVYNKRMTYDEVLQHAKKSKCILNIIQDGAEGITLRDYEAIGLNKILMTNGENIFNTSFNTPSKIIEIEKFEEEYNKILEYRSSDKWNGIEEYSVKKWYEWLENQFTELNV